MGDHNKNTYDICNKLQFDILLFFYTVLSFLKSINLRSYHMTTAVHSICSPVSGRGLLQVLRKNFECNH